MMRIPPTHARLFLPALLACATLGTQCLAAPGRSQPASAAEDVGEKRGPLLIRKRTVEVQPERGTAHVVGPVEGDIVKALLSGDGKKLAIFWRTVDARGVWTAGMEIWSAGPGTSERLGQVKSDIEPQGMAWRPQGDALAWGGGTVEEIGDANGHDYKWTGHLLLWAGGARPARSIAIPNCMVRSVAFTRDGRRVVAACGDVRVRIFNYASGKLERTVATPATAAQYAAKMRSRRR